ncbi:hypothetical protein ACTFIR_009817 [Dictyostelium discoideum]
MSFLDGFDVLVPSQNGYQFADVFLRQLNKESEGYDFGQTGRIAVQGPYFYHCLVPEFHSDFVVNCLTIGDNNEFNVITNYYWSWNVYVLYFPQIYENYTIVTNETLINIKNQVYVGLIFTNSSVWGDSNSTFLFNRIFITHVIQPQFSPTKYCLFFSNITNSSILFDIYQNKVILNHNHFNLNISRHLYENSSRSINYFMYPKQFTLYNFTKYSEPTLEPIKNNTQPNNYANNENNSSTLTVSFSILTISVLLLSFIFFL